MELIYWLALVAVLCLVDLWTDNGDGRLVSVDFAGACSIFSDKDASGQTALAQVLGEAHCAPSLIGFLSTGRLMLRSPVNEEAVSTKRLEANR